MARKNNNGIDHNSRHIAFGDCTCVVCRNCWICDTEHNWKQQEWEKSGEIVGERDGGHIDIKEIGLHIVPANTHTIGHQSRKTFQGRKPFGNENGLQWEVSTSPRKQQYCEIQTIWMQRWKATTSAVSHSYKWWIVVKPEFHWRERINPSFWSGNVNVNWNGRLCTGHTFTKTEHRNTSHSVQALEI